jgi:transposase
MGLEELSRAELMQLVVTQHAQIQVLEARIAQQDEQIAEQGRRIAELTAELEKLRRVVSRNSGNSSSPKSKDDELGRQGPAKQVRAKPSGRPPGKQRGGAGSALAWVDDPVVENRRPEGACGGCGADLAGAADEGVASACQITDIPRVTAVTVEYRMRRVRCGCGRAHTAAPPAGAGVSRTRVYGPNLKAFAVYLLVRHAVPVERAGELIGDLTGAAPSAGLVHGMLARTAAALAEVTALIKTLITLAHVAHFDETTLRCGPVDTKQHVWVASTSLYTAFHLGGRDMGTFAAFGIGAAFGGVAVHDRYRLYTEDAARKAGKKVFGPDVLHQVCTAHLIRDLEDAVESLPGAHWPAQAQRALRGLIHQANLARAEGLPRVGQDAADPLLREFRHAVRVGLAQVPRVPGSGEQPKFRALLEFLRDREAEVTRFVFDTRVPPTNNLAESDLRPQKTQQKISGRLRSPKTTEARLVIAGYLSTLRKHGLDVMAALHGVMTGAVWEPVPVPT